MTLILHNGDDPGLWRQTFADTPLPPAPKRPALFLDRDGVLLDEVNYLHKINDMHFIPGAATIVRAANKQGIPVIIISNQAGVGRGYYGWAAFATVQAELVDRYAQEDAYFDMVLACAYHADAIPPFDIADHPWRKPRPGMLLAAETALSLDLSRSWIFGDAVSDIEAGRNAGLAGGLHVLTGHGTRDREAALGLANEDYEVLGVPDIGSARCLLERLAVTS